MRLTQEAIPRTKPITIVVNGRAHEIFAELCAGSMWSSFRDGIEFERDSTG
jgi:hypothetical protein